MNTRPTKEICLPVKAVFSFHMDAVTQYIKNIGQFGVILALLLTMGAVAQEKDKGTGQEKDQGH